VLLENGANLEATGEKGDTCLSLSEKSGHEGTISFIKSSLGKLAINVIYFHFISIDLQMS